MSGFSGDRVASLLEALEQIAGGDLDRRIKVSGEHDELDAIAHAINVLVGELQIVTTGLRRAKEEAEAASLAKTMFLRNVSHEIRTPLTVVLGMSDLLASQNLPRPRVELFRERIFANGRALVGLLDELLDLAKVEAERIDFDLQPLLVAHLVAEVIASFEADAARKGIKLVVESATAEPMRVFADKRRLRQIFMNILGNAVKFTERGHVAVRIARSADASQVVIDIADTGIGMTPAQSRVLFEPFMQADATIGRRYGGSGLGLAISRRFTQGMGGTLDVIASAPGSGTTFRLALPATTTDASLPPSAAVHEHHDLRALRILVVEDHDDVRATTVELLRRAGAVVSETTDGLEAIDAAQRSAFDVILMDVRMPKLDGIEATRRLRARGLDVPIVALTADAVPEQRTECMSAGCSGYLPKPLDVAELITLLDDLAG
ncbi:MAG: response regulator [Kofleriaceae bacterium]|nr:response regulator [Kofleriaceae bacterium]